MPFFFSQKIIKNYQHSIFSPGGSKKGAIGDRVYLRPHPIYRKFTTFYLQHKLAGHTLRWDNNLYLNLIFALNKSSVKISSIFIYILYSIIPTCSKQINWNWEKFSSIPLVHSSWSVQIEKSLRGFLSYKNLYILCQRSKNRYWNKHLVLIDTFCTNNGCPKNKCFRIFQFKSSCIA